MTEFPAEEPQNELSQAVIAGDTAAVHRLLTARADLEAVHKFQSALQKAVTYNRVDIMRLLLDHGANPNVRHQLPHGGGSPPLHFAAITGRREVLLALLAAGADPNLTDAKGYTPLMGVMMGGHTDAARILLEHGAVLEAKGPDGVTALWLAVGSRRAAIVRLFLKWGADVTASDSGEEEDPDEPKTLLQLAELNHRSRSNEETEEILQMLSQKGVSK